MIYNNHIVIAILYFRFHILYNKTYFIYFHENEYNDYEFYIDPAAKELDIESNLAYSINTSVMFIGKKYKKPVEAKVIHESSPEGLMFRYYYYKVITPYTI